MAEPDVRAKIRYGARLQRAGDWQQAGELFGELATARDAMDGPARHSPVFPGRGQTLDCWLRSAMAFETAGLIERAEEAWRRAEIRDAALVAWRTQSAIRAPEAWPLIDGPLSSEDDALALIDRTPALAMPDSWWFCAYIYLYRLGWVRAAYKAKVKAAEVVRSTAGDPAYVAVAWADAGAYGQALKLLPESPEFANLGGAISLLAGRTDEARTWRALEPDAEDEVAYRGLVSGKSVAVVGAADPENEQGAEIDGFDLVVRTNFRGADAVAKHAPFIGRRTDIAYFNGNFEPANRDSILRALEDGLRYLVLRFHDNEALATYRGRIPVRVSSIANPFYRMNAYAIPKIIHDLLRFNPARIKVFNADFFLGAQTHYAGYLDYEIRLVQSFRGHDVLRNVRFMKLLWEARIIEADSRLQRFLSFSEEELVDLIAARLRTK